MEDPWNALAHGSRSSRRRHYRRALLRNNDGFRSNPIQALPSQSSRKSAFAESKSAAVSLCSAQIPEVPELNTSRNGGALIVGGLAIVAKLAAIFVTRVFCSKAWPFLQTISLSTLLIRRRSSREIKIVRAAEMILEPLHWLAVPVFWVTISQHAIRWLWPDGYRTLRFWRRLLPIYVGYMKTKWQVRKTSPEDREKAWAVRHEWGGEKVYELILDMSGFYVKSAQILASKSDFVPEAWTRQLSKLLDSAPPRPFREVELSLRQELARCPWGSFLSGKNNFVPLDAVFLEVEKVPLATASIAQVHGGVLKNGTRAVVKVQHRGMAVLMHSDLRNIVWLAKFLQGQLPVDLLPIVKEIQSTIPLEFNFEREVWFMNAIKNSLEVNGFDQIVCPCPYPEFCSKRLIVMQRIDGVPFTQILHASTQNMQSRIPEAAKAVEYLIRAYGQMLFIDGVFHADPHAGNLFLLPDGRLGLLDYGQSKAIDVTLRQKLARMILKLCEGDELSIALALVDLGVVFQPEDQISLPLHTVAIAARILFDVCYMEEATVSPMAQNSILRTIPLKKFNQALWMVVRTNLLLRGLCFSLKLDISAAKIWQPYASTALQVL